MKKKPQTFYLNKYSTQAKLLICSCLGNGTVCVCVCAAGRGRGRGKRVLKKGLSLLYALWDYLDFCP